MERLLTKLTALETSPGWKDRVRFSEDASGTKATPRSRIVSFACDLSPVRLWRNGPGVGVALMESPRVTDSGLVSCRIAGPRPDRTPGARCRGALGDAPHRAPARFSRPVVPVGGGGGCARDQEGGLRRGARGAAGTCSPCSALSKGLGPLHRQVRWHLSSEDDDPGRNRQSRGRRPEEAPPGRARCSPARAPPAAAR